MSKRWLFVLILALCVSVPVLSFANVRPETLDVRLTAKPGEKVIKSLMLYNDSKKDIIVKAYFEDMVFIAPFDGRKDFKPLGSTPWSLGESASVSPRSIIVPASGKMPVTYSIDVPPEAKGGYYGILFVESGSASPEGGVGMGMTVRVGCSVFLETAGAFKRGSIEEISLSGEVLKGAFLNTGNVLLVAKTKYHIMNNKGIVVHRAELQRYTIPPGEKAPLEVSLPADLKTGPYTLLLNSDLGDKKLLVKEIDFSKDGAGKLILREVRD